MQVREKFGIALFIFLLFIGCIHATYKWTGELLTEKNIKYSIIAFLVILGFGCIEGLAFYFDEKKQKKKSPNHEMKADEK